MFDHYLITRFNLKKKDWTHTKNNEALLTDNWLEERFWLFENFCLPSVTHQTTKNFMWLLYFDTTTTEKHKQRILQLTEKHDFIKVFFIDGMDSFYPSIQNFVKQHTTKEFIITSRIDNDDVVHKDFIKEIQNQFAKQDYLVLDFIKGYSLQILPNVMLGKKQHIYNPFSSLIEKNDAPKTIWFNDHHMWKKENRIKHLANKRLWIAIIHEKNKVNNFNGYGNVKWQNLKNDFIISNELTAHIENNAIPEKKWVKLSLKNAWIVNYKVMSKLLKKKLGVYRFK